MRKRDARLFQIGRYWLSKRRDRAAYYATWFDEEKRRTCRASLETDDLEAAQIALADFVRQHGTMRDCEPAAVKVRTLLRRYYNNHAKLLPSGEAAFYAVPILDDAFGELTVDAVTLDRQRGFIEDMRKAGRSDGYIRRLLAVLKAALNRAVREGEITAAPHVMLLPESEPRERIATTAELAQLLAAARSEHLRRYLVLAIGTAARPGSILELTTFQCDLVDRFIQLNPRGRRQNKKRRPTIPMADFVAALVAKAAPGILVTYSRKRKSTTSRKRAKETPAPLKSIRTPWRRMVVEARRRVRRNAVGRVRALWRAQRHAAAWKALDEAHKRSDALLEIGPYTIRHTMATEMRRRGVEVWEVAGFLGHTTGYKTTERYAKIGPGVLAKAVAAIEGYFDELLDELVDQPGGEWYSSLCARCAPAPRWKGKQVVGNMVVRGVSSEPVSAGFAA
ncbi:MAG: tyrosine-type recombinase/integrase [Alphaproteobacteria bacterium]|nr:tyrosine-type recombinase/integrase [Alphaproteobacteria bacterium]